MCKPLLNRHSTCLFVLNFCFCWDRILLHSPGWPGTRHDPRASALQVSGSQVWVATPDPALYRTVYTASNPVFRVFSWSMLFLSPLLLSLWFLETKFHVAQAGLECQLRMTLTSCFSCLQIPGASIPHVHSYIWFSLLQSRGRRWEFCYRCEISNWEGVVSEEPLSPQNETTWVTEVYSRICTIITLQAV